MDIQLDIDFAGVMLSKSLVLQNQALPVAPRLERGS